MSYDLTIRSDENFSQYKQFGPLADFLSTQPNVKPNGPRGFTFEQGTLSMEIDFETASEEGDNSEDESTDPTTFNCVRAHIPYPHLGDNPERDYFPLLRDIAQKIGWKLYDEQSDDEDEEDSSVSPKPWWKFW